MEPITGAIMKVIFFELNLPGGRSVPFVLIWLLLGALIFTLYFRFVNVRAIRHTIDVVRGKYDKFSLDMLVTLATRAGGRVELAVC